MKLTVKNLKKGYIFAKNGYRIYYISGKYCFSAFNNSASFKTLKELKQHIKDTLTD